MFLQLWHISFPLIITCNGLESTELKSKPKNIIRHAGDPVIIIMHYQKNNDTYMTYSAEM